MTGLADPITALAAATADEVSALAPGALADHPVEQYVAHFAALPALAPYHAVPDAARAMAQAIAERGGERALEAYNRLAMLALIGRGAPGSGARLTDDVAGLLAETVGRILGEIAAPRKGYHRHGHDPFAKDFAVCRGKLVPGGVELVELASGVGRSAVLRGGLARAPASLAFMVLRMGGFRTFFALHFDRRMVGEFHAEGYAALYRRLAGLLEANPQIGGIVSASWWHDPALADVSPELRFVDSIPRENGARILRLGEDPRASADAIRLAPGRAALHKQGRYHPCVHLLAWPRRAVLDWAAAQRP